MDRHYREEFNRAFTSSMYEGVVAELGKRLGTTFGFRLAETPVFLPEDLCGELIRAGREIIRQLSEPQNLASMREAIPAEWDTPGMQPLPAFTQIDFAVVRDAEGRLVPKLIELQGFPSVTALQIFKRDLWNEILNRIPALRGEWSSWFGLDRCGFLDLARRCIVGTHDPEHVILMDLDPRRQKTWPDFAATRQLFRVDAVCPTELTLRGNRLWRRSADGRELPVKRIYNRVVFDELERKRVSLPFSYTKPPEVEWAPHPNWYWVWSKYSIPFLRHPAVPEATLLSEVPWPPGDLSGYVLKPLFSFAGGGVNVAPRREDLERIPPDRRRGWCLQRKIVYAPALRTPDGAGVKVEIRLMYLTPDDAREPVLAQNLCRLSRGAMMGVDFNRDFTWVGSSIALQR
jgi:hypothetical protein